MRERSRGRAEATGSNAPPDCTNASASGDVDRLAVEAEHGYDVDKIIARGGKRGRPRLGVAPSTVESVRLDPDLKERLTRRAHDEGVPVSDLIRKALRHHLEAS